MNETQSVRIFNLHGVRYRTDVVRAAAFYTDHLGFRLQHQQLPAFASVVLGDFRLLLSGSGASGSRPLPGGEPQQPGGWNRMVLHLRRQRRLASGSSGFDLTALGLSDRGRWFEKHAFARHRRVGALTAIEAAGRPLSRPQFRERLFYADCARVTVSGRANPADPVPARHRRDVHPQSARFWVRRQRFRQIRGHPGLRPECHRFDRHRHRVAYLCSRSPEHAVADTEPVASYAVGLERCLKRAAVQRAFNHTHPARRKLATGGLRQSENRLRADGCQFGLESDFRHKPPDLGRVQRVSEQLTQVDSLTVEAVLTQSICGIVASISCPNRVRTVNVLALPAESPNYRSTTRCIAASVETCSFTL